MQTSWIITLYIDAPYKLSIVGSKLLVINWFLGVITLVQLMTVI